MNATAERVAIFCDASSLWYQAKQYGKALNAEGTCRVDYQRLRTHLSEGRPIVCASVYVRPLPSIARFCLDLEHLGYTPVRCPEPEPVCEAIARDLRTVDPAACDVVVLVTGGGGYGPVMLELKASGLKVEIHAFPVESPIQELAGEVDRYCDLPESVLEELGEQEDAPRILAANALINEARARGRR